MNQWYQITIDDPELLPGTSIYNMILNLKKIIEYRYVILNDIVGTGNPGSIPNLIDQENSVVDLNDLLKELHGVRQFEWGDFFLFKDYPSEWNNPEKSSYPFLIAQSDTLVRAIDNQYMYVYTPYDSIVQEVKEDYQIESLKFDTLDNLDYPY